MQALRTCSRIATPSVAHKAEAIVAPDDLIRYFGVGRHHGKVSNIAYHNSLMVHYWGALASRDTRLMTHAFVVFSLIFMPENFRAVSQEALSFNKILQLEIDASTAAWRVWQALNRRWSKMMSIWFILLSKGY